MIKDIDNRKDVKLSIILENEQIFEDKDFPYDPFSVSGFISFWEDGGHLVFIKMSDVLSFVFTEHEIKG